MTNPIQVACFKCGTYCTAPPAQKSNGSKCQHKTHTYIDKKPPKEKLEQVPTSKMFDLEKPLEA